MELALDVRNLKKRYGPTVALADFSLACGIGEVHGLLGENGAGKSTLVKILSGVVHADEGQLTVAGKAMHAGDPKLVSALGVSAAFQEISLVRDLSIAQNFLICARPDEGLSAFSHKVLAAKVEEKLAGVGVHGLSARRIVRDLDLPTRQKVEIARAICRKHKVLLLDEPTASLSARDVQWLGERIVQLRQTGVTILFISHRLPEVRQFCSRLTILRNGRDVAAYDTQAVDDEEIIRKTIGRSLAAMYPARLPEEVPRFSVTPALEVKHLTAGKSFNDVSFKLETGRILGVGALEGMGQRELFLSLFGLLETTWGEIAVQGRTVSIGSPSDAIAIGISLVPEDRRTEGLFLSLDCAENATLPQLARYGRFGLVSRKRQEAASASLFSQLSLDLRALWSPARVFSGGNQQKVVLAKWLLTGSPVLLLYDPTRGVDVGAKAEIYALMRRFVAKGGAILFYSTEIAELVNLSDEVAVMYAGHIATCLSGEGISEHAIMTAALGQAEAASQGGSDGVALRVH
jgi:ribose transport system ATP-binding protein